MGGGGDDDDDDDEKYDSNNNHDHHINNLQSHQLIKGDQSLEGEHMQRV